MPLNACFVPTRKDNEEERRTMAANIQFQHAQEATLDMVNSYREVNQAVAGSLVSLQRCYLRLAHSLFRAWIDVFMPQIQQTPRIQKVGQPTQKQQDACHRLISPQRRRREGNQSQVAVLRERLDRECEAYSLFCNGFAITASHPAITKRMQVFGGTVREIQTALVPLIGDEQTTQIIGETFQEKVT
jgi:hypothetical protein